MYTLIKNFNALNLKHYKIINKKILFLNEFRKNHKIIFKNYSIMYSNLKLFNFSKIFYKNIFINKNIIKNIFFLIVNQNTFNLKINSFGKKNNFYFSVGIILIQLKLFKKKLRKSFKSYRLLISYLNNKLNHDKIDLIYILLKNSKKNSVVTNYIFKILNLTNMIFFYKPNNYINTNFKNKKSIKKKIKKKIIIKNNLIL